MRYLAVTAVLGLSSLGCHGSESCRLRHENARLEKENAELKAEAVRLLKENLELKAEEEEDDDAVNYLFADLPDALKKAQDAYVGGEYQTAIQLALRARQINPQRAWRIIGASHCFLKNRAGARAASTYVDGQGRAFLKYVCSRNDVAL
jgi:hypothetical protein